ncbi:MAG: sulfur transferase domain-containing protein [Hyphomicrobium sp.]
MLTVLPITDTFAVAATLAPEDYERAAALGFRTVLSFLPDGEVASAVTSARASHLAQASGLVFAHIPASKFDLFTDNVVSATRRMLAELPSPVLATCSSGQRAAIVWAAAEARSRPVDTVLLLLASAGFDLAFLRDDLDAQADRQRWLSHDLQPAERAGHLPAVASRAAA